MSFSTRFASLSRVDESSTPPFQWVTVVKYLPLAACAGFFAFSVLWLAIGPLDWGLSNQPGLYVFLAAVLVALVAGYVVGMRWKSRSDLSPSPAAIPVSPNVLVIASGVLAILLLFPTSYVTTGSWVPDVLGALTHSGDAYANTKNLQETASPLVSYIRFLLSPVLILAVPITYFLWSRLSTIARVLGVLAIGAVVALTVAQGINKGMADFTAYTCLFLALYAASSLRKGQRHRLIAAGVAAVVVGALFLSFYAVNIQGRIAHDVREANSSSQAVNPLGGGESQSSDESEISDEDLEQAIDAGAAQGRATERQGHFVFALPGGLRSAALLLSSYATHGYVGLSMALNESWTPTYGLGFSEFLRHNVARVAGGSEFEDAVVADTYAGKIEEAGYPVGLLWPTFFIYPASDISFPGVVVLVGLIGFLFATAWRDTVVRKDPLAAVVFYSLCTLVFYLPANNQLFQGGETAIGFTVVLVIWLVGRTGIFRRIADRRSHNALEMVTNGNALSSRTPD